jgi:ABC-2 type transport system permease protein
VVGVRDMIFSVFMLLSGQLIPVSTLPGWIREVSRLLPFEGIYFIPARIYSQSALGPEVAGFLLQQGIWIALLGGLGAAVWSRGLRRYASQGG